MTNQLIKVTKDKFFSTLCAEKRNILTHTIEGGGKGDFFPLTDIWYYTPNQSNIFGKTVEFGTTGEHLNEYYIFSK